MYKIFVEDRFSAAHQIKGYKGECEKLHGHNFKVKVTVEMDKLNELGMGMDFREIKKILKKIIDKLDHTFLNELPQFKSCNPTAENIARYIFGELKHNLPALQEVKVWESDTSGVSYSED